MTSEESILQLANSGTGSKSLAEAVEWFSDVMELVLKRSREVEGLGTDYRNTHPAVKLMATHLKSLVDFKSVDDLLDGAYAKLKNRGENKNDANAALYEKYWHAMDASNLSGVLFTFRADLGRITAASAAVSEPLSQNPIAVCVVDKLCQLARA